MAVVIKMIYLVDGIIIIVVMIIDSDQHLIGLQLEPHVGLAAGADCLREEKWGRWRKQRNYSFIHMFCFYAFCFLYFIIIVMIIIAIKLSQPE